MAFLPPIQVRALTFHILHHLLALVLIDEVGDVMANDLLAYR